MNKPERGVPQSAAMDYEEKLGICNYSFCYDEPTFCTGNQVMLINQRSDNKR